MKEAWTIAIETLSWMQMQNLSESLALARTVEQLGVINPNATRLAHRLVTETIRRRNFIDAYINKALGRKRLEEYDFGVQAFLRLFVYQNRITRNWMQFDAKESAHIANLGRSILGWKTLRPIEPFLGMLLTQKSAAIPEGKNDDARIGLTTFHPTWYVKYCIKLFGRPETIRMLTNDVEPSTTYLRFNILRMNEKEIHERLVKEGIRTEKIPELNNLYSVTSYASPLTRIPSYTEGLIYIQDKASCFATQAGNPKPRMIVLDICAAPGAKTTYLAQLMNNEGTLYSVDFSIRRMNIWQDEIKRMGITIAEPIIADAKNTLPLKLEADLVILDPPCTSTGTFKKSPSDKWRITPNSVQRMAEIQWEMINACEQAVKPQGALVYSTCSMTVEENEMIVERFLRWHPNFSMEEIYPHIGSPGLRGLEKCRRLYPHIHQCNGFFIAKLRKIKM